MRLCCSVVTAAMVVPPAALAQAPAPAGAPAAAPEQGASYSQEQLDQLLAPIALYPDGLLSQVLMAATYPLEVVEAARWVKANPDQKGDAAVKAVEDKNWDVSVQSLVAFPQTVTMMSDKLEWTQDLGNAVLAQQKDVLDSVQRLRGMAQKAGTLESNEQQKVTVEPAAAGTTTQTIIIEPAQPETIYVPAYNPTVVYGTWPYPAYMPFYYPPNPYYYPGYYPGAALARGFAWGVGFAAAGAIFGGCNWGRGDINVNVNRATNINRNFNANSVRGNNWQHNSTHRKGVSYKDPGSRQKYGRNTAGADAREQFRGRDLERELGGGDRGQRSDRAGDRGQVADRGGDRAGDRGGDRAGDRGGDRAGDRGGDRGQAGDRGGDRAQVQDRASQGRDRGAQDVGSRDAGSRGQASARAQPAGLDGMGSRGSDVRAQASRGQSSRQASQSNFGGGGARASGGGGGGGARMSGGGGRAGGGGGGRGGGGRR